MKVQKSTADKKNIDRKLSTTSNDEDIPATIANNFSQDEIQLLNIGLREYDDLFPDIIKFHPKRFMHRLERYIEIATFKLNGIEGRKDLIEKIIKAIQVYYYEPDYKKVKEIVNSIDENITPFEKSSKFYYIPHCNKNTQPVHSCGEKMSKIENYLICINCEQIYKCKCVLFHCQNCNVNYYTSVESYSSANREMMKLKPATWQKYHCNVVFNDTMKCPECREVLYLNTETLNLTCLKCKYSYKQSDFTWKCILCHKEFKSEAKVYNPLEYKVQKVALKKCLFDAILAKPESVLCCGLSEEEINNETFLHSTECNGILYKGSINGREIVVCGKCHMLNYYENHYWLCPLCHKRFNLSNKRIRGNSQNCKTDYKKQRAEEEAAAKDNKKKRIRGSSGGLKRKKTLLEKEAEKDLEEDNNNIKEEKPNKRNFILSKNKKEEIVEDPETLEKYTDKENLANLRMNIGVIKGGNFAKFATDFKKEVNKIDSPRKISKFNDEEEGYVSPRIRKFNKGEEGYVSPLLKKAKKEADEYSPRLKKCEDNDESPKSPRLKKRKLEKDPEIELFDEEKPKTAPKKEIEKQSIPKKEEKPKTAPKKEEEIKPASKNDDVPISSINSDDYTIISNIGEGSFGKIYKVSDKNKKFYALKKILINSQEEIKAISGEYVLLSSLSKYKLNLVTIYGMEIKELDKTTYALYILMDLALSDWDHEIENREKAKKFYSESELWKIMKELIFTFSELQSHNISHRDIKPQNILIFPDNTFRIADFGEAKEVLKKRDKETYRQTIRGTELYMSPILFKALNCKKINLYYARHNTYKSDVYSLGLCFLLAAALTYNVLEDIREIEDMNKIKAIIEKYLKGRYSKKLLEFIYIMIDLNEKTRPDFKEMVKIMEKY